MDAMTHIYARHRSHLGTNPDPAFFAEAENCVALVLDAMIASVREQPAPDSADAAIAHAFAEHGFIADPAQASIGSPARDTLMDLGILEVATMEILDGQVTPVMRLADAYMPSPWDALRHMRGQIAGGALTAAQVRDADDSRVHPRVRIALAVLRSVDFAQAA